MGDWRIDCCKTSDTKGKCKQIRQKSWNENWKFVEDWKAKIFGKNERKENTDKKTNCVIVFRSRIALNTIEKCIKVSK